MLPHEQPEGGQSQLRARLAAEKIAARRNRAANPRDPVDGYVAGGRYENIIR